MLVTINRSYSYKRKCSSFIWKTVIHITWWWWFWLIINRNRIFGSIAYTSERNSPDINFTCASFDFSISTFSPRSAPRIFYLPVWNSFFSAPSSCKNKVVGIFFTITQINKLSLALALYINIW